MTVEIHDGTRWRTVCTLDDLQPGRGVAVLLDGEQVAVFRDRSGGLHALDNRDPFSGAHVLSRGLLGSRGERPTLASPMYKQVFDLTDGRCLDEETAPDGTPAVLRLWPVRSAVEPAPAAARPAVPARATAQAPA
ncbi:nitrite reductase small subunit NirD [Kitasatospora sp. NBC_01246]|uniref:nitrite reductase small subunit NirD n=1 Tax=unclassified Kitasatospora TaxID=2633591 RepID=UPI002E33EF89|nr:nitrite reductase small subunit NirD [Kitasatospora sp. NBC_01246]